jgi:hypothetical protein
MIKVNVMLTSLNKLWHRGIEPSELEDITCRWWYARGARREHCRYVFGVHNGVIRSVYPAQNRRPRAKPDRGWEEDTSQRTRWGCDGAEAPEMQHFLHTSVEGLLPVGQKQWSFVCVGPLWGRV